MIDHGHLPSFTTPGEVQVFGANSNAVGANWHTWYKPRGKSMLSIWGFGCGGGGGDAVAGAASLAAGGGGGGSGGQTYVHMPLALLPDVLFVSVARGNPNNTSTTAAASFASYVATQHVQGAPGANSVVWQANGGASGGKSAGNTPGPVGTAGAIATAAQMPLGFAFAHVLAGQVGIIGGAAAAVAGPLAMPVTGLMVTGGTGGGGVRAVSTAGWAGGLITGVGNTHVPVNIPGGVAGATTPTGGGEGTIGRRPNPRLMYFLGGTGGGSSGLSAASGSTGGNGANGGPGCGGGGGGGAFTAFAFGVGGRGGDAMVIFTTW